jgi:hypothetical protein
LLALFGAACPDPKARLEEFEDRVVDASLFDAKEGTLEDITGEFYVGFEPQPLMGFIYLFIWKIEMTMNPEQGTATIKLTSQSLDFETREIAKAVDGTVPDPIVLENIPVSASGQFVIPFDDALIPGRGNPFSQGDVILDLFADSVIESEDVFCGVADENSAAITPPLPLAGSTFGATRIEPGTIGAALPAMPPIWKCPEGGTVDAGVDGGTVDAGPIDAGPIDAAPIDASIDASTP